MNFLFTPKISGAVINNCLASIMLKNLIDYYEYYMNIDHLWNFRKRMLADIFCWKLQWRIANTDADWNCLDIPFNHFLQKNHICFRLPIFLYPISVEIRIKARYLILQRWSKYSNVLKLNINSYNVKNDFKINDIVYFISDEKNYLRKGSISKILNNNIYKIKCFTDCWLRNKYIDLSSDKLIAKYYDVVPNEVNIICCGNKLIKNDRNFNIIKKALYNYLLEEFMVSNRNNTNISKPKDIYDLRSISFFITKNVYDFLFIQKIKCKIHCLFDGNPISCKYNSTAKIYTQNMYENYKLMYYNKNTIFGCLICNARLNEWNYIYECNIGEKLSAKHLFCYDCVNQILILHNDLNTLLKEILYTTLSYNCIELITDFVVGFARINQHNINDSSAEVNVEVDNVNINNKRKIVFADNTNNKKRRLK